MEGVSSYIHWHNAKILDRANKIKSKRSTAHPSNIWRTSLQSRCWSRTVRLLDFHFQEYNKKTKSTAWQSW